MTRFRLRPLFLIGCLFFISALSAQNLVPNPSFEAYNVLPCGAASPVEFRRGINHWIPATSGSPDIISSRMDDNCSTHPKIHTTINLLPKSGKIMVGMFTWAEGNFREYVQCKLKQRLTPGREYEVTVWVARRYDYALAADGIGMCFRDSVVEYDMDTPLPLKPQVRFDRMVESENIWVRLQSSFVATSAASYLVIGNFGNNEETRTKTIQQNRKLDAYYYLDDVSVELIPEPEIIPVELPKPHLIYFATGSSELTEQASAPLDSLSKELASHPEWAIRITGHTDDTGNDAINMSISKERAQHVLSELKRRGVQVEPLETTGLGYSQPLETGHDEAHRWRNRRVEIEFIVR